MIHENEILQIAKQAIEDQIVARFASGYNSPLQKMIDECMSAHDHELRTLINCSLDGLFSSKEFTKTISEEFTRKVAKSLVGKLEGTVERAVDKLKQDPTLKARMIIAIENIINDKSRDD